MTAFSRSILQPLRVRLHRALFVLLVMGLASSAAVAQPHPGDRMITVVGRGEVVSFPAPVVRAVVGDAKILDYSVLSTRELLLVGKSVGTTNMIVWTEDGRRLAWDIAVDVDLYPLRDALRAETDVLVTSVGGSVVLSGWVADIIAAQRVANLAEAFVGNLNRQLLLALRQPSGSGPAAVIPGPGGDTVSMATSGGVAAGAGTITPRLVNVEVVNHLRIRDPQQVMLDVRIAEVSRDRMSRLGIQWSDASGSLRGGLMSGFVDDATLSLLFNGNSIDIEAQRKDSVAKVLAEPTIVAISGQEGSFLLGGRFFIPTPSAGNQTPGVVEREFGIGLTFLPTVLDDGRINLKVRPEVSDISPTTIVINGQTSNVIRTNTVSTTVQIREGENLVIGGLLRDDITETIRRIPLLGDVPVLGALFRSSEFQKKRSELVVVVRPTLVKATPARPPVPTDTFVPPSSGEFFLGGSLDGAVPSADVTGAQP